MHIYLSGVGGVGIGPLARIARDLGHQVTGSDSTRSRYTDSFGDEAGITVVIGQSRAAIEKLHMTKPIDWFVYTSGLSADHPELKFAQSQGIRTSKRDEFIVEVLREQNLKMIAVAGTHGKTTTTAMLVWLARQVGVPVSYSIGTQIPFGPNGLYDPQSEYFIYEADEYDRNFLHYEPAASLLVAVDYDHPDTYPTPADYQAAFRQFGLKSELVVTWQSVADYINLPPNSKNKVVADTLDSDSLNAHLTLLGAHNRRNGYLAACLMKELWPELTLQQLFEKLNGFPGTERRMERLATNLYTDYAHHPNEIRSVVQMASELKLPIALVYQPHQNIRQHELAQEYGDCFDGAELVYWLPTYLSREDPELGILTPADLISKLTTTAKVQPAEMNETLEQQILSLLADHTVVCMSAGDLDGWVRQLSVKDQLT